MEYNYKKNYKLEKIYWHKDSYLGPGKKLQLH